MAEIRILDCIWGLLGWAFIVNRIIESAKVLIYSNVIVFEMHMLIIRKVLKFHASDNSLHDAHANNFTSALK